MSELKTVEMRDFNQLFDRAMKVLPKDTFHGWLCFAYGVLTSNLAGSPDKVRAYELILNELEGE